MRPIDADEVFKAVYDMACQSVLIPGCEDYAHGLREAANYIENAPTLDAVPVIRCRECKHKSQGISDKMRTWCSMWQCWILQGDGYCHMAAKMDAGQEDENNGENMDE